MSHLHSYARLHFDDGLWRRSESANCVYCRMMFRQATRILTGVLALLPVALCADVSVAGTWEGKENGLPAVELSLRNDAGQISGTIGFYFQTRGPDGKWHLDGNPPFEVPLLSPKLQGTVLTFETIHHRRHGSAELGPNNKYRVAFLRPKEARLQVFRYGSKENGAAPGLKLIRRE
jgi:hypothetical protein